MENFSARHEQSFFFPCLEVHTRICTKIKLMSLCHNCNIYYSTDAMVPVRLLIRSSVLEVEPRDLDTKAISALKEIIAEI